MMVPTLPPLVVIMTREVSDLLRSSSFSPSSWQVIATDALLLSLTKLPPTYVQTNQSITHIYVIYGTKYKYALKLICKIHNITYFQDLSAMLQHDINIIDTGIYCYNVLAHKYANILVLKKSKGVVSQCSYEFNI